MRKSTINATCKSVAYRIAIINTKPLSALSERVQTGVFRRKTRVIGDPAGTVPTDEGAVGWARTGFFPGDTRVMGEETPVRTIN